MKTNMIRSLTKLTFQRTVNDVMALLRVNNVVACILDLRSQISDLLTAFVRPSSSQFSFSSTTARPTHSHQSPRHRVSPSQMKTQSRSALLSILSMPGFRSPPNLDRPHCPGGDQLPIHCRDFAVRPPLA